MKIIRLYADADGESRFEELEIDLEDAGEIGRLSARHAVDSVIFRENPPGYDFDWHTAPERQYIVMLDGEIEVESSTGEQRRFAGGEILLVEDTWGKGHRTRSVDGKPRRSLFVPLGPGVRPIEGAVPSLPDLSDAFPEALHCAEPIFSSFGGHESFHGPAQTVKCFEDNSKVKELAATSGEGRVMVVDGGGSLRRALLGDQVAARAAENGWVGFVIHGAVRDVEILETLPIGVLALAPIPVKTEKRGLGDVGVEIGFAGLRIAPGHHVYVDANGLGVSTERLVIG